MASTFKNFLSNDITTTRTALHEAVPITGSILARTYGDASAGETNIKTYGHKMFVSVYDYPYLSSSANHLMDITFGTHPDWDGYGATAAGNSFPTIIENIADPTTKSNSQVQYTMRKNIYAQMQQILVGRDANGISKKFDRDGNFSDTIDDKYHNCVFISLSRLLVKDEIKKGTFELQLGVGQSTLDATYSTIAEIFSPSGVDSGGTVSIKDTGAQEEFRVNSPAGEYGILYVNEADGPDDGDGVDITALNPANDSSVDAVPVGLIYYQTGIVVLNMDWMAQVTLDADPNGSNAGDQNGPDDDGLLPDHINPNYLNWYWDANDNGGAAHNWYSMMTVGGYDIDALAQGLRHRINKISFNNTTELNSTIYFCRANHNEFNYSTNPSYLSGSKIVVKENTSDNPVSYVTTVGLYSADQELLAVAKLSEPLKKDPTNELTLRVRLDY